MLLAHAEEEEEKRASSSPLLGGTRRQPHLGKTHRALSTPKVPPDGGEANVMVTGGRRRVRDTGHRLKSSS